MVYAFVLALLTTLSMMFARAGFIGLGPALFPVPVAVYWALGARRRAVGLVVCAALAAWAGSLTLQAAVFYGACAGIGLMLGAGFERRWTVGRCLAAVTLAGYALTVAGTLATWDETRGALRDLLSQSLNTMRAQEDQPPGDDAGAGESGKVESATETGGAGPPEAVAAAEARARWVQEHFAALAIGFSLWGVLLLSLALLAVTVWLVRLQGGAEAPLPTGRFSQIRVPEWLVWAAIAAALLFLYDQRWPNGTVRVIAWNSGLALAAVYWLNGLAIAVYAFGRLRLNPFLVFALLVLLLYVPGTHLLVCSLGFFDTWADWRGRDERQTAAQRRADDHNGNDD